MASSRSRVAGDAAQDLRTTCARSAANPHPTCGPAFDGTAAVLFLAALPSVLWDASGSCSWLELTQLELTQLGIERAIVASSIAEVLDDAS